MELSHQSYEAVMAMPVKKMYDYLKWKSELEETRHKEIHEKTKSIFKGKK
jgi:hypothetical protein